MSTPHPLEEQNQTLGSLQWDPYKEPRPPSLFQGFFSEENAYLSPVIAGAGQGAALLEQGLGTLARGAGRIYASVGQPRAVGMELTPIGGDIEADARDRIKALTPNAATTGAATQLVHGLASGAYRMGVGAALAGPIGGATTIGLTSAQERYLELRQQNVDEATAGQLATFAGVLNAAGAFVPGGFGSNLLTRVGTGAAGNVGFGMFGRYMDHATLEEAGYKDMAAQQKVWDSGSVMADLLLGGTFGAITHVQARGEARANAAARIKELENRLGRGAPGAQDAGLALSLAAADDRAAPGVPVDPAARTAHATALEQAQVDLELGRPVNVAGTGVEDSTFARRPAAPDTGEAQAMLMKALQEGGFGNQRDELARLEQAMGARLAGEKGLPPETVPPQPLEPRGAEESDAAYAARLKNYLKTNVDVRVAPDVATMGRSWQPYFTEQGDGLVPVANLGFAAEPEPGTHETGLKRMAAAAAGEIPKREPLSVSLDQNGVMKVTDGKGTLGALRRAGVEQVPVRVTSGPVFDALERAGLPEQTRQELLAGYMDAARGKPNFDATLTQIAKEAGASRNPDLPSLKGAARAAEKAMVEKNGSGKDIRDLLRGTIVVDNLSQAQAALELARARFGQLLNLRNGFVPDTAVGVDGYRDIKFNVANGDHLAEVQINLPEILAAKDQGHALYEEARLAPPGPRREELLAESRTLYGRAWSAVLERERKAASESTEPLRIAASKGKGRPPGTSQAVATPPGPIETGVPSTSAKEVPGANEPGVSTGGIVPQGQTEVHLVQTAAGQKIAVRPKLVEAADLVTSDRPEYPKELQPRQRGARAALTEQVASIARNLNPEMLGNAPEADRGAPIVGPGNVVESGNGRVFALRKAYEEATGQVAAPTKTKADLRKEFIGRDDAYWNIEKETEARGSEFRDNGYGGTQCTGYACAILHKLGSERVKVYGFHAEENPTSSIAQDAGGHDFAVVDGKYIVDPWLPEFGQGKEGGVYDLTKDKAKVAELYGDREKWKDMTQEMPAAREPTSGAGAYRAWLAKQGYNVEGMKQPVLVRERMTPMTEDERRAFTVQANQTSVAALSPVERAAADARLLDGGALSLLHNGEIASAQNAPFVRAFLQKVPEGERNALVNPDGTVSQEGVRRLQAAILGKAYGGSPESNAVLGRMLESTDTEMRSTMGALLDAAPAFAKLRQAIEDGKVGPEYDLAKALTQAIETTGRVRESGQALTEFLKQEDFLTRRLPIVDQLMRAMYDKSGQRLAGREKVAQTLMNYADRALKQRLDQGMLFGDRPASPEQLLTPPKEPERQEMRPATDMFGLRRAPAEASEQAARQVMERTPNLEVPAANGDMVRARAEMIANAEGVENTEERAPEALSIAANCFGQRAA